MSNVNRTGGAPASAAPHRAVEKTQEDVFGIEADAAARHAVLVRRLAHLDRLVGVQPRRLLLIVGGASGGVAVFLVLAAMCALLCQQWQRTFELVACALVVPHVLRAALILLRGRVDEARLRARAKMASDHVAWHDAHLPRPRHTASAMVDDLDASTNASWREQWALVLLLAPRVLPFALFVAGTQAYHAIQPRVEEWLEHRRECGIERLDAAVALLDLDPDFRARELARCPNLKVATFRDASGAPTAVGRSSLASVQAAADDGTRAAIEALRVRSGVETYLRFRPEQRKRYEEDGAFREGFESVLFLVYRPHAGDPFEAMRALETQLDARANGPAQ
jgi:hypothetical protein